MLSIIVAKTLIFNSDGKLLKIRRSEHDDHRPGGVDIPGGKIDDGEKINKGAIREIFEEVGITIDPISLRLAYSYTQIAYNTDVKSDVNVVWLGFMTQLPKGQKVKLSHEHQEYSWQTIEEALTENDSTSMTRFLEHIKSYAVAQELWDPGVKRSL